MHIWALTYFEEVGHITECCYFDAMNFFWSDYCSPKWELEVQHSRHMWVQCLPMGTKWQCMPMGMKVQHSGHMSAMRLKFPFSMFQCLNQHRSHGPIFVFNCCICLAYVLLNGWIWGNGAGWWLGGWTGFVLCFSLVLEFNACLIKAQYTTRWKLRRMVYQTQVNFILVLIVSNWFLSFAFESFLLLYFQFFLNWPVTQVSTSIILFAALHRFLLNYKKNHYYYVNVTNDQIKSTRFQINRQKLLFARVSFNQNGMTSRNFLKFSTMNYNNAKGMISSFLYVVLCHSYGGGNDQLTCNITKFHSFFKSLLISKSSLFVI